MDMQLSAISPTVEFKSRTTPIGILSIAMITIWLDQRLTKRRVKKGRVNFFFGIAIYS
jgi:hypothetical protein